MALQLVLSFGHLHLDRIASTPIAVTIAVQAINAPNQVDVFFVIDKGKEREGLLRLRKEICERSVRDKSYRTIEAPDPARDRSPASYQSAVASWHEQRPI
jgi:precorrin-6A synthase